jgi:hypothetical protein
MFEQPAANLLSKSDKKSPSSFLGEAFCQWMTFLSGDAGVN